ncbi:MAG: oligosaccharide flippase family protein [Lachnospiraceae bacterium]|nr:oligosaccharide flippase family protein [Lachnospiraceae bacterium]
MENNSIRSEKRNEYNVFSKGANISLIISIIFIPMQLLTAVIASRISEETSGVISITEIYYNIVVAFFYFGGETALIKLLSDYSVFTHKVKFILRYTFICLLYFTATILFFNCLGIDLIKLITASSKKTSNLMYICAVVIIVFNIVNSFVKEQCFFTQYTIGNKIYPIVTFICVIVLLVYPNADFESLIYFVLIIFMLLSIVYFAKILKEKGGGLDYSNTFYMQKFFRFSIYIHSSTIVAFIYDKIDQILVNRFLGLSILGGYYLIIKVINVVKMVPFLFNSVYYPYICKNVSKDNANGLINKLIKRNIVAIVPVSILLLLNSRLCILVLFGEIYLKYDYILLTLLFFLILSIPGQILNNLLFAVGESKTYFYISLFSVIIQVGTLFSLIQRIGLVSIIISKFLSSILIIVLCKIFLDRKGYRIKFNKEYYRAMLIGIFCMVVAFVQLNYFISFITSIVITLAYCYRYRYDIKEIFLTKGGASEK